MIAHNLARWTARIGLGEGIVTTKTLRRRLFALAGRLTRSARQLTLHLPTRWPWAVNFTAAPGPAAGDPAPDLTPLGLAGRPVPGLRNEDRLFWSAVARLWAPWRSHLQLVQPETVIGWHRTIWRRY